ncbi:DUF1501 domain-containing protein [Silvibacterium sp.]|uniref:DUF1501 domain-containing protein n=1 Tax=Silvibacterium sp. TaxID=1964179 RepID=UPI0039E4D4AE
MLNRRGFLRLGAQTGLATAFMPLWMRMAGVQAYAQSSGGYKAIVCITLEGGNDGNNTVVPLESSLYNQYTSLRQTLALSQSQLHQVQCATSGTLLGLHPSLTNLASIFSQGNASIIANCGPMDQPLTKAQLQADATLLPELFGSHPAAIAQWESATTDAYPTSGWGGRIADQITSLSGSLPPVISVTGVSTFTVGESIQSISAMKSAYGSQTLPAALAAPAAEIAALDQQSANTLIEQSANMRIQANNLQSILQQSLTAGSTFKTTFPTSTLGQNLLTAAQAINGRSVVGASRQIFYCSTGNFDTHGAQVGTQATLLSDLDASLGAFVAAMQEIGMLNDVLIVTLSDFGRTMQSNSSDGSDHGWGNHQFVIGGGLTGRQLIGSLPDFDLGGSQDYTGQGVWIPTIATQQISGAIASWFGLTSSQIASIFPNLAAFSSSTFSL